MGLQHFLNVTFSLIREHAKRGTDISHSIAQAITGEAPRSPHWPTIEKRWKEGHPDCAACGGSEHVQVHHKESFKLDPGLELHDGTDKPPATPPPDGKPNFISLCMGPLECHLRIGHGGSFRGGGYNPNVASDSTLALKLVRTMDPRLQEAALGEIWDHAKASRITQ
jgi:5-methylcytosine-specific restriction protein A